MFVFCHVKSGDHMIVGKGKLRSGSPSNYHHCANFGFYRPCKSGDIFFLSRDHMVKEICELVSRSSSPKVTTVPSLVVAGLGEVEM